MNLVVSRSIKQYTNFPTLNKHVSHIRGKEKNERQVCSSSLCICNYIVYKCCSLRTVLVYPIYLFFPVPGWGILYDSSKLVVDETSTARALINSICIHLQYK